jgi:hypothetical protein
MRLIRATINCRTLRLVGVLMLVSPAAFADFGPDALYSLWDLATFAGALIVLPLLAPRGWRIFWIVCTLVGYPLSCAMLGNLARWATDNYYTNFRMTALMALVTWLWIACVLAWMRFSPRQPPEASANDTIANSIPRSIDIVVILIVVSVLIDCQSLLPRLAFPDTQTSEFLVAIVALPLLAAMGLWYRRWWAFALAIGCAIAGIALEMRIDPQTFAWLRYTGRAPLQDFLMLWYDHTIVIATLFHVVILGLLIFPVRAQLGSKR